MKDKRIIGVVFLCIALILFLVFGKRISNTTEKIDGMVLTALSVGKADALILQQGDTVILIDTGEEDDGEFIKQELIKRGIQSLDALLITHFDKDHVGSASYLMENMKVEKVYMPDYEGERKEYQKFLKSLEGHSQTYRVNEIQELQFGDLVMTIYPAENPQALLESEDEIDNDMSLVCSVAYGEKSFLLTGDIEKKRIEQMLDSSVDWKHDWIKLPHHGRYQKAVKKLLEAAEPKMAVVCCSEEEFMEEKTSLLLEELNIPVWDTSSANIVTICNGKIIQIEEIH